MRQTLGVNYVEAFVTPDFEGTSGIRRLSSWVDVIALAAQQRVSPPAILWVDGAYLRAVELWGEPPSDLSFGE